MLRVLACLFLPLALRAQQSVDTLHYPSGEVLSIRYSEMVALTELTKAELFQRGIDYVSSLDSLSRSDSTLFYNRKGERVNTLTEEMRRLVKAGTTYRTVISPESARSSRRAIVTTPVARREGRRGSTGYDTLRLHNYGDTSIVFELTTQEGDINLPPRVEVPPRTEKTVPVSFTFPASERRIAYTSRRQSEAELSKRSFTIAGYDLSDEDFMPAQPVQPALHLRARPHLLLRLRGGEKLLTVTGGGEPEKHLPVGRGLDRISIRGWPAGEYTLMLTDLGSDRSIYARIVIE